MAAPSGTSFIPKQPASGNIRKRTTRKVYVLAYVSFVFFFGTLIAGAGTMFYELSILAQLESERSQLVELQKQFNQAEFQSVKQVHAQMGAAKDLLDKHVSVLQLMQDLEDATAENIQLSGFKVDRQDMGDVVLEIEAVTDNFNTVLFQRDVYERKPTFQSVILSDFVSEPKGLASDEGAANQFEDEQVVKFVLTAELPPSLLPYVPRNLEVLPVPPSSTTGELSENSKSGVDNGEIFVPSNQATL